MKTLIQSDFDGTLTQEDVSYQILDAFTGSDWRQLLNEYQEGKRPVLSFTREAFAMVKEDGETLIKFVESNARIRDGVYELVDYCSRNGFHFVIVSNGLDFYIKLILERLGLEKIPVFAAKTRLSLSGMGISYLGPDGRELDDGFKAAYTSSFLKEGYRVIYIGDGLSDIQPARLAHHVFARGVLLEFFKEANLSCESCVNLRDVVKGLEFWRHNQP